MLASRRRTRGTVEPARRVRFLSLSLIFLAAVAPAAARPDLPAHPRLLPEAPARFVLPTAAGRRHELASGAVVYLAEDHTLPLIEIAVGLRVGTFLDPPAQVGLASLTGALVRRGGAGDLPADAFDDRADELGALLDSSAGTMRGGASLSVPTWAFEEALDLFVEMLARPRFDDDRLASARTSLLEAMGRRNLEPLELLEREWEWLLWGNDHFSTLPLTPGTVAAIARGDLETHHRRHWQPAGMVLAASGDFEPQRLLAALEDRFAGWSPAGGAARSHPSPPPRDEEYATASPGPAAAPAPPPWPPPAPGPGSPAGLYHLEFDTPQAKVLLGHRLPERPAWDDPVRPALAVLGEVLGGRGAVSRLAGRLRTAESLVYRVEAQLDPGDLWAGALRVFFDTAPGQVARSVAAVRQELERLRRRPVRPEELAVAKRTLLTSLRLEFDTAEEVAGRLAEDELLGRPRGYWEGLRDGVEAVTADRLLETARAWLAPDRLVVLVLGPWRQLSGNAPPGLSALEQAAGHPVTRLPERDPLTLDPLTPSAGSGPRSDP